MQVAFDNPYKIGRIQQNDNLKEINTLVKKHHLDGLDLSKLALEKIPTGPTFKTFRILDLSGNELQKLPSEIKELHSIEKLTINFNKLSSIPDEIGYLTNLKILHLAGNKLSKLPNTLSQLKNLKELNISFNKFEEFPYVITKITSLESLNISGNSFKFIPIAISNLKSLKRVDMIWMKNSVNIPKELSNYKLEEFNYDNSSVK